MTYNPTTHQFTLTSGREFYAYGGRLSLDFDQSTDLVYYGSDGEVHPGFDDDDEELHFTSNERQEIAAHMIALWSRWGARLENPA
jgi:hypothetical protein